MRPDRQTKEVPTTWAETISDLKMDIWAWGCRYEPGPSPTDRAAKVIELLGEIERLEREYWEQVRRELAGGR
jgi:hypothetical protein